ncbi:MAG: hypothetical protein ACFCBW_07560 [Candidatus Competibacterales bacterium]
MHAPKLYPHPTLAHIDRWPHPLEGTIDIIDCGDPEGDHGVPAWSAASLVFADGSLGPAFALDGRVMAAAGVTLDEIDDGALFRVHLEPHGELHDGEHAQGPRSHHQIYRACKIEWLP